MNLKEVIRHLGEMIWKELREFPGKGKVAVLRDEARTIIMRLPDTPHYRATADRYRGQIAGGPERWALPLP